MRQAPAVHVTCPGRGPWLWAQAGLTAIAVVVLMRWLLAHADVAPAPAWTMAALVGASIGWLAWRGGSGPDARLAWNGSTWSWSVGDDAAVAVERVDLRLDLGGFLLLHLAGRELPGGARWVAADGRDRDALRLLCAVLYAGAGRAAAAPTPR